MDRQAKIELLKENSFAFDVDLTLDEIEWTRILGPNGLGNTLLHKMVELGGDFFNLQEPSHVQNGSAETFCFALDGDEYQIHLDYEQPFTASLQSATKQILDGVNNALRRQAVSYRFVCVRDTCTGAGCTYRLMLLPTPWLRDLEDDLNIVSGLNPEDYELERPFAGPASQGRDIDGGFLQAR